MATIVPGDPGPRSAGPGKIGGQRRCRFRDARYLELGSRSETVPNSRSGDVLHGLRRTIG